MDSHNHENSIRKYDEKSLEKLQSRVVFTTPEYQYIFKKTEKVIAALYLITNLISDIEPIKWQIRKISLGLMSDMLSIRRLPTTQSRQVVVGLVTAISEIISLLKIASIADHISSMNYTIVQRELMLLISNLDALHAETLSVGATALPQDFFNVPVPIASNFSQSSFSGVGQAFQSKGQYRTSIGQKDNQTQQAPKDNLKDNRHQKMLQLLKAGKPLGIKDFANEIKDCSEKTLQRELLAMVETGILKKTGERRWSLYSLA